MFQQAYGFPTTNWQLLEELRPQVTEIVKNNGSYKGKGRNKSKGQGKGKKKDKTNQAEEGKQGGDE